VRWKKMKKRSKEVRMFGKEGESTTGEGKMNSIIGKGCKVNGTVDVGEGTLRIDGEFDGTVNCPDTLVIGKDGRVKADIQVKSAVIGGTLVGNIDAKEKIELQAGSHVEGDIKTRRLVIDEGVFFEGSCKMSPEGKHSVSIAGNMGQQQEKKEPAHAGTK
jgi:cytoskeletal protein CcmA (bactofilin family)